MVLRMLVGLLAMLSACSSPPHESKPKLRIESGPNQGTDHTDTMGTKWNYRYVTATITNDSAIPTRLQIALPKTHAFPTTWSDYKYKVFLLPRDLTPNPPAFHNNITDGLGNFFDTGLDNTHTVDKTLEPGEQFVATIGTLYLPETFFIVPTAIFAQSESDRFRTCDNLMGQAESGNHQLLGLKLDFHIEGVRRGCILISCGQISYPKR